MATNGWGDALRILKGGVGGGGNRPRPRMRPRGVPRGARGPSLESTSLVYSPHKVYLGAGAAYVNNIWLGFLLRLAVAINHYLSRVILLF